MKNLNALAKKSPHIEKAYDKKLNNNQCELK
jgi:hypothetical protein